jgi:RimJ/RimL family protein N-acetyltransferase
LAGQPQPTLTVGGLTLRPWGPSDAPDLVRAYADADIRRWHARSLSLAEATSWTAHELNRWAEDRGSSWAITEVGAGFVGRVGIGGVSLEEARAGATYWVLPEARGRGVAPLALGAVADWAFDEVGFHRIELDHSTKNPASCRVALKAGFTLEGTRRARALHLDGWHDMHAHGLLASDPRPRRRDP